jgi:hypothetical protein
VFEERILAKPSIERSRRMGWQASNEPWAGEAPGRGGLLLELPASFAHGGAWDDAPPSAALADALEAAAGPDGSYAGADVDALVGIARQWAALESWAAAGLLASLRAMMREDGHGRPILRRRGDLPQEWDDSLNYEVAAALAMGPVSAGNLASLAWTLGTRLAGIGRLLADGTLTRAKAKLVAAVFEPLDDGEAARAEALILGELAGKTYFQVERLAWRAALAVAPDVAERRRKAAERERARVTVFREESGAVGLSGRDLPAAQALSGHANVVARAREYAASGAFDGQTISALEALAYLHLLNGVTADDAVAFARTATETPDNTGRDRDGCGLRGDADSGATDVSHAADCDSGHNRDCGDGTGDRGDDGGSSGGAEPAGGGNPGGKPGGNPGGGPDRGGGGGSARAGARPVVLPAVTVPLATLLGLAERPGENRLLGAFDPALARDLAAAAARSPLSRWEVTIVDRHGYAVGHGVARLPRGSRAAPWPPGLVSCALSARVNITVTEASLRRLAANPRSGAPPGGWGLTPRAPTDGYGVWTLTLPGGRGLTVCFDVVPTHACDHRYEVAAYQPTERLRRLVEVRDRECTFPTCSRPAHESDFEHAVPFDRGGKTDACNAGARSRRCHQVKQMPGWNVAQPRPGWHRWTTPTGRSYVQGPWRYTA